MPPNAPDRPKRRLTRAEAHRQTRDRLLTAAADVFKRLGYNGASLEAVAEAAGYTKGAVYSNFAAKSDLFIALLERYVDAESQAQRQQFAGRPLTEFVDSLDQLFQRQVVHDPTWVVLQIEFWLAAVRDPAIRERLVQGARDQQDSSGDAIGEMLEAAEVRTPFSGREIGVLLNALATGFAIQWELDPDSLDPKLLVRAARVLVGLDQPPATSS
jgi:AcrR family transcriptional regulator